jgi:hypothetical protein
MEDGVVPVVVGVWPVHLVAAGIGVLWLMKQYGLLGWGGRCR